MPRWISLVANKPSISCSFYTTIIYVVLSFFTLRSNLVPEMLVSLTFVWIKLVVDNKNNIVSFFELLADGRLLEIFMLRELMFVLRATHIRKATIIFQCE